MEYLKIGILPDSELDKELTVIIEGEPLILTPNTTIK